MEPAQHYSRALFLFALLTLLCVGAYGVLPEKRWEWLPQAKVEAYVYSDQVFGGNSEVNWQDQANLNFACELKPTHNNSPSFCGIRIHLTDPWLPGADLSRYDRIEVEMDYQGGNKKLRFYMMEFVDGFSDPKNPINDGHAKYLAVYVPSDETQHTVTLNMSEFLVADWWVNDQNVPRQYATATRSNIMTFGVDISYPAALGPHQLQLKKVTFVGPWITAENWYLGIVLLWATLLVVGGIARFYYLRNYTAQLQQEKAKYQQLSMVDALTGLLNRHGLMAYFESDLAAEERYWPIAMVLLDIDYFKRINDGFGHSVGDVILRRIGETISAYKPEEAQVARWGGEEFLLLLPHTDRKEACVFAELLRTRVMNTHNPEVNGQMVTISIGVGELGRAETFEHAFKRVDDALYRAKSEGRNCFVCEPSD